MQVIIPGLVLIDRLLRPSNFYWPQTVQDLGYEIISVYLWWFRVSSERISWWGGGILLYKRYSRDPPRNLIIIQISEPFLFQPNTFQVTDLVQLWSHFLESPNQFRRKVLARLWASCSWRNLILRKYLPVQFRKQLEGRKLHNIRKESPRPTTQITAV